MTVTVTSLTQKSSVYAIERVHSAAMPGVAYVYAQGTNREDGERSVSTTPTERTFRYAVARYGALLRRLAD